jgi:hypothetical protein
MTTVELQPEDFDALEQAEFDAANPRGPQEHRYHEWVGEDPESEAAANMAAYLKSRPEKVKHTTVTDPEHPEYGEIDKIDAVINPDSGEVMLHDGDYFEDKREKHYEASTSSGETLSMSELAKAWGQAELDQDRTKADDFQDILIDKMEKFAKAQKTTLHPEGMTGEAQEKLFNRIIKIKDNYIKDSLNPKIRNHVIEDIELTPKTPRLSNESKTTLFDQDAVDEPITRTTKTVNRSDKDVTEPIATTVTEPVVINHRFDDYSHEPDNDVDQPNNRRPRSLKDRVIGVPIATTNAVNEKLTELRERNIGREKKRRNRTIAVIGGLAVAAAAGILIAKYGFGGGSSSRVHEATHHIANKNHRGGHGAGTSTQHLGSKPNNSGTTPNIGSNEGALGAEQHLSTSGDTIWYHAKDELIKSGNLHPSNYQVLENTQRILNINHITWEEARHLPVGYAFKD